MSTDWRIGSQKQGIAYILEMIEKHGSLAERIEGLHFHQSLSGAYCRKHVGKMPPDFPEEYFAAFAVSYGHIQQIDRHRPWTEPLCAAIIDRAAPKYLTHELSSGYPGGQLGALKRQLSTLRRR